VTRLAISPNDPEACGGCGTEETVHYRVTPVGGDPVVEGPFQPNVEMWFDVGDRGCVEPVEVLLEDGTVLGELEAACARGRA